MSHKICLKYGQCAFPMLQIQYASCIPSPQHKDLSTYENEYDSKNFYCTDISMIYIRLTIIYYEREDILLYLISMIDL